MPRNDCLSDLRGRGKRCACRYQLEKPVHLDPFIASSLTLPKLPPKVILGLKFLFSLWKFLGKCSLVLKFRKAKARYNQSQATRA